MGLLKNFLLSFKSVSSRYDEDRYFGRNDYQQASRSSTFKNTTDYINAYELIAYVGDAVRILAGDIASLKYRLINESNEEIKPNNDISNLLSNPNKNMGWYSFCYTAIAHILLDGNAFLLLDKTNALSTLQNSFDQIIPLIPSLINIYDQENKIIKAQNHSNNNSIKFYRVGIGSRSVDIPPEFIIQAKIPSPMNFLRGMGIIQQNANILDADKLTSIFNKAFFNQGARTNLAVIPNKPLGRKEQQLFKRQFQEEYGGYNNWAKIMTIPYGTELKELKLTHDEMQYIEQKQMTRKDIFGSMFHIPPIRSGVMEDAKYDSATDQWRVYYETVLPTYYRILEQAMTAIVQRKLNERLRFEFIPKNVVDIRLQSEIADRAITKGVINGNEYRKMIGLNEDEKNEHLNTYYISMNMIPAEFAMAQPVKAEDKPQKEKSFKIENTKAPKASMKAWRIHYVGLKTREDLAPKIEKQIRKFYKEFEERIFKNLPAEEKSFDTKNIDINSLYDETAERQLAKNSAMKWYTQIIVAGIKDFNNIMNANIDMTFQNGAIKLTVERLAIKYADQTLNTRKKELKKILDKAIEEGSPISETKNKLRDYFKTLNEPQGWRADRIARTEISSAYDQSAKIAYKELNVEYVQVIGCQEKWEGWDCDTDGTRGIYPIEKIDTLSFHPFHSGSIVPILN